MLTHHEMMMKTRFIWVPNIKREIIVVFSSKINRSQTQQCTLCQGVLCSTLLDFAQLCSSLLEFAQLCSILLDFALLCLTLLYLTFLILNFAGLCLYLLNFTQLCLFLLNFTHFTRICST